MDLVRCHIAREDKSCVCYKNINVYPFNVILEHTFLCSSMRHTPPYRHAKRFDNINSLIKCTVFYFAWSSHSHEKKWLICINFDSVDVSTCYLHSHTHVFAFFCRRYVSTYSQTLLQCLFSGTFTSLRRTLGPFYHPFFYILSQISLQSVFFNVRGCCEEMEQKGRQKITESEQLYNLAHYMHRRREKGITKRPNRQKHYNLFPFYMVNSVVSRTRTLHASNGVAQYANQKSIEYIPNEHLLTSRFFPSHSSMRATLCFVLLSTIYKLTII